MPCFTVGQDERPAAGSKREKKTPYLDLINAQLDLAVDLLVVLVQVGEGDLDDTALKTLRRELCAVGWFSTLAPNPERERENTYWCQRCG